MKNSSLHILKAIFSFLLGWLLVLSCTKDDVNQDTPTGVPNPNSSEIVVKLLIKGEEILPPSTRAMDESTEGTFQESLLLFILEKQGDKYVYNCHRSVKKGEAEGSFIVRVPSVLKGKDLKFLLFANSKNVIGENPDEKFLNQDEDFIRKSLIQNMGQKWENWAIPMWAEDTLTPFNVPADGAQSTAVANLKLVRMLARVDVGLGYPKEPNSKSTAAGLGNFKLKTVKVYHSKNRGQLMPNANAYETTGTGADKIITIKSPSIPADVSDIQAYSISVSEGVNACEREIYMFEQLIKDKNTSGFKKERTCILIQGEYTGTNNRTYVGWYRLDFRDFGDQADYTDVLRNKLYRFNIIEVKGSGYTSEEDALNSQASNITVNLQAMDLEQNDIIFDGQSFLSVNTSELFFYQNRNTANFTLNTNYGEGTTNNAAWKIKTDGTTGITASPNMGPAGNVVVSLTWDPLPSADEEQILKLTAGNLEKTLSLKYIHDNAPDNLTSFSLEPPFFYFLKGGGEGKVSITTNITKKYLSTTLGNLEFDVASEITANNFDVKVKPFPKTGFSGVEKGAVNVNVKAANAEITATCIINQLTYDKALTVPAIGTMVHGVGSNSSASFMNVPYTTNEGRGTYMISFKPVDGGYEISPHLSNPDQVSGQGMVQIMATPNKTSKKRVVGKLQFKPAENGQEINLVGYTAQEFDIMQEPVPAPSVSIQPNNDVTELPWNQRQHSFIVSVDNPDFAENNNVSIVTSKSKSIDMTVPSSGTLGVPIDFDIQPNRGDNPKSKTLSVAVDGHGDHVGRGEITFIQQAPESINNMPVVKPIAKLPWNATEAILELTQLSNIYEVKVLGKSSVGSDPSMVVDTGDGNFTMVGDNKTSARLAVAFEKSKEEVDRKVKITAQAIGNRMSEKREAEFTLIQEGLLKGVMSFANTSVAINANINNGNVLVNTERIERAVIEPFVETSTPQDSKWVNFNYSPETSLLQYATSSNKGKARSVTFSLRAKDMAGRDVIPGNKLTLTQQAGPTGIMEFAGIGEAVQDPIPVPNGGGTRQWDVRMQNINLSTLRIDAPGMNSVVKSAQFNADNSRFTVELNPNMTPGGAEIWTEVAVRAKDYHDTSFEKRMSFKIAENPVIPIVKDVSLVSGTPAYDTERDFDIDIPLEAHSKNISQVSFHSSSNGSFIKSGMVIPKSDRRGAVLKAKVTPNSKTYQRRTADVVIGWKASGQSQVITTRHKISQDGHAPIGFNVINGSLPEKSRPHIKSTTTFTATISTKNLDKVLKGLSLELITKTGPQSGNQVQWVGANGSQAGNPIGNQESTVRIKLTTPDADSIRPWVGEIRIKGRGVDGNMYTLRTLRFEY